MLISLDFDIKSIFTFLFFTMKSFGTFGGMIWLQCNT